MHLVQMLAFAFAVVFGGFSLVVQQAVNADLSARLGSAAWAGFVSYLGGTFCMLLFVLAAREGLPSGGDAAKTAWFAWTGGFWGTVYIVIAIYLVPQLGAASFIALLVAGQMLTSLLFDHYGLLGVPQHPADATRILGALLLLAGVVLLRS